MELLNKIKNEIEGMPLGVSLLITLFFVWLIVTIADIYFYPMIYNEAIPMLVLIKYLVFITIFLILAYGFWKRNFIIYNIALLFFIYEVIYPLYSLFTGGAYSLLRLFTTSIWIIAMIVIIYYLWTIKDYFKGKSIGPIKRKERMLAYGFFVLLLIYYAIIGISLWLPLLELLGLF